MQTAACSRCRQVVPAAQTDFTTDGLVCRGCLVVGHTDPQQVATLSRELARSTARKHMVAGGVMTVFGIGILSAGLSGGGVAVVPVGLLFAGVVELARGAMGLPTNVR